MPVTGANKVKSNLHQLFNNIATNKVMQFGNAVMANAASLSKEKAPIEFGTLVNSQRIDVTKQAGRVIFSLGYYTGYAAFLNNTYKWKPRPPAIKAGNAWNPDATPHFLEYGFESSEAKSNINRYMDIFKV